MKIFILKLLSLFVLILGLVSLGIALGVPQVREYMNQVPDLLIRLQDQLPPYLAFLKGALTVQGLWFGASVAAIVLGVYGFFPQLAKYRRKKKIAYTGPHGEVQIHLDSVEQSLNHVLARMPEVKKIDLRVDPQDGGRRALIRADVVLYQQPGQNARAIAALVSDYIAESATKLLGLEELATIDLNVIGICVNSRKSSKAIRKESLSHSANAPVELLEAAPAPLSLSAPGEPIGSASIEEELDEEAESAMEATAVDTKRDVANQAAARSELLEPLSVGETAYRAAQEPSALGGAHDESHTEQDAVAPRDMDVLEETLEDSDEDEEDEIDVEEEVMEEASYAEEDGDENRVADAALDAAAMEAVEAPLADSPFAPTPAPDEGEPALTSVPEASEAIEEEDSDEEAAAPVPYPWEQPAHASEAVSEDADGEHAESDTADEGAEVSDAGDDAEIDSVIGDTPGDVTFPETEDTAAGAPDDSKEKKRWGSWFN